jgi:hypothetical protein
MGVHISSRFIVIAFQRRNIDQHTSLVLFVDWTSSLVFVLWILFCLWIGSALWILFCLWTGSALWMVFCLWIGPPHSHDYVFLSATVGFLILDWHQENMTSIQPCRASHYHMYKHYHRWKTCKNVISSYTDAIRQLSWQIVYAIPLTSPLGLLSLSLVPSIIHCFLQCLLS